MEVGGQEVKNMCDTCEKEAFCDILGLVMVCHGSTQNTMFCPTYGSMIKKVAMANMNSKFKVKHTSHKLVPLPIFRWSLVAHTLSPSRWEGEMIVPSCTLYHVTATTTISNNSNNEGITTAPQLTQTTTPITHPHTDSISFLAFDT